MSLSPVPSEQQPDATCANCGAQLVADQRYCLSCGQPVTPVRLAFLDALAPAGPPAPPPGTVPAAWAPPGTIEVSPAGYVPIQSQQGTSAWLRRNSGLMGLLTVLVLCLLAGLLIGHWVSQSKAPANQTIKIEGLSGLGAAAGGSAATTPATTTSAPSAGSKSSASQEAKEVAEGEHETKAEKAPPKAPKKVTSDKLKKLTQSKGKKHQEEIDALGAEPIETG